MKKNALLFATGGSVYPMLEILCRGHTDLSMSVAGGICLCLIDRICNRSMKGKCLAVKCCAGSGIITSVEFAIGLIVNVAWKQDVWDYSNLPLNIMGQVCLPFSILWFLITIPELAVCNLYDKIPFILSKRHMAK